MSFRKRFCGSSCDTSLTGLSTCLGVFFLFTVKDSVFLVMILVLSSGELGVFKAFEDAKILSITCLLCFDKT